MAQMHVLDEDGRLCVGAAAFVPVWDKLPLWSILAMLTRLPLAMPVINAVYGLWASNRHVLKSTDSLKGTIVEEGSSTQRCGATMNDAAPAA
jgi:predicted DCC family thiol-disulfide oxidoreductase YuxK